MAPRLVKVPTRRQLAQTLLQTIPVVNGQSHNMDALNEKVDNLRVQWTAFQAQTRWQRLKWLMKG